MSKKNVYNQKNFDIKNNNFQLDIYQFLQRASLFAHKTSELQLQIVRPLSYQIEQHEKVFEQLYFALQHRYYNTTKINKIKNPTQHHRDNLNTLIAAQEEAYQAWATFLPAIPESYEKLRAAIEKQQAFLYRENNRKLYLKTIDEYAKLAAEIYTSSTPDNAPMIQQFKKKWTTSLNNATLQNNKKDQQIYLQLLEYLQKATDNTREPINKAKYCKELVKFFYGEISLILEEVAKIDKMLGLTTPTTLINADIFTDFTFADFGGNADPTSYRNFISNLQKNQITTEMLEIMLKEFTTKCAMIYATADSKDKQSIQSKQNYIQVVVSLRYLLHLLPEPTSQFSAAVNYQDKDSTIQEAEKNIINFIQKYLTFYEAYQQQISNTEYLSQEANRLLTEEVESVCHKIREEVELMLQLQQTQSLSGSLLRTSPAA